MEPLEYTTATSTKATGLGSFLIVGPASCDRDRLVANLEAQGYSCCVNESVETAYEVLDGGSIDILAVASTASGAENMQLIRDTQASHPCIRAIVYGGRPTPESVVEAIRSGASDWINLPGDTKRLPERVAQIIDRVQAHRSREEQLEELTDTCRQLSEARDEMSGQVDVLCSDLASAYRTMREQMSDVAMSSEFKALVSQELDVEDMLRTSLEYILQKIGPTNAVVYLKEGEDQYGVGAYVNYQWQESDLIPMLNDLSGILCRPMSTERELVRFDDTTEFAEQAGGTLAQLDGSQVVSFACHRGDECLAIFVLFRDAATGFDVKHATLLDVLRTIISEQLSKIIRIHKRSKPEWPDEPAGDNWDIAA